MAAQSTGRFLDVLLMGDILSSISMGSTVSTNAVEQLEVPSRGAEPATSRGTWSRWMELRSETAKWKMGGHMVAVVACG